VPKFDSGNLRTKEIVLRKAYLNDKYGIGYDENVWVAEF